MTIESILDYVNNTSYNTNIGILRNKLDIYTSNLQQNGGSSGGNVRTVNNILPDESGNIALTYASLNDKPFGDAIAERIEILPRTTFTLERAGDG